MSDEIPKNLTPPLQNPPGAVVTTIGESLPFYQFVTIRRGDELNLEIWSCIPAIQSPPLSDETYVENVIQTYAVQIPYTEVIDGKTLTKFRIDHRTRTVPVTKYLPKTNTPKEELVEETYSVSVPYTEHLENGVTVTRTRLESRTRLVDPNKVSDTLSAKTFLSAKTDSALEPLANVTFYNSAGNQIGADVVFDDSTSSVPAIQIAAAECITNYFAQILAPNAILFVVSRPV